MTSYESEEWLPLAHKDTLTKKPFDFDVMKIYHPKSFLDLRTDKQGAVVTICSYPWQPMDKRSDNRRLRKISVSAFVKQTILDELGHNGINCESLFLQENKAKEIEDICREVNCKYENLTNQR